MDKITNHLWFDTEAEEAANLYVSAFKDAEKIGKTTLHNTPSGSVDIIDIEIAGQGFTLISAGPYFKFNPSISFLVACDTKEEVDFLWNRLIDGGMALMELGEYPFSGRYGWGQDKFGLSWQIMLKDKMDIEQRITPTLMFTGDVCGKAEEAMNYYVSVFRDSKVRDILRYTDEEKPDEAGTIKHEEFTLENQDFAAMDSAYPHGFSFNEAISFMVRCNGQEEIDYYWDKLSVVPEAEQCGWLKDKYGVSWQVVPVEMDEMMRTSDEAKLARITEAFLKMKKLDIEAIRQAAEG
jgi:predicted 3-demethylubiquinone-9 3-methyltransferase (glyoxalase superfamily)